MAICQIMEKKSSIFMDELLKLTFRKTISHTFHGLVIIKSLAGRQSPLKDSYCSLPLAKEGHNKYADEERTLVRWDQNKHFWPMCQQTMCGRNILKTQVPNGDGMAASHSGACFALAGHYHGHWWREDASIHLSIPCTRLSLQGCLWAGVLSFIRC